MARARNIKPAFFTNDKLVELPFPTRLLFVGLWTLADREGRLEDRPKKIKMELFPGDDVDVDEALASLVESGFILRYTHENTHIIQVRNFLKHQSPHSNETASTLPECDESTSDYVVLRSTCHQGEQGLEPRQPTRAPADSLFSDSLNLIPDTGLLKPSPRASAHGRGANYPEEFEKFWTQYPNKKAKDRALKAWRSLQPSPELQEEIIAAIARQRAGRDWVKDDGRYIPHPSTWLNDAGWMDEVKAPSAQSNGKPSPFAGIEEFEQRMNGTYQTTDETDHVFETTGGVVR